VVTKDRAAVGKVADDGSEITFDPANRKGLDRVLMTLKGQEVDVIVRPHKRIRSAPQNAWHWAIAVPLIAGEVGYEPHDKAGHELVHYALVAKCFGTTWNEKLKQEIPNARSSQLTTEQFSTLMEWEVRYAATEYGLYIPLPDEVAA
jgi:hypothetical protein